MENGMSGAAIAIQVPGAGTPPPQSGRASRPVRPRHFALALVAFLLVGNLGIAGASAWARSSTDAGPLPAEGIKNFRTVDGRLWRGAAPSERGYRWLAAQGVRTVVDLRAERDLDVDYGLLNSLGLELVVLPMRDGQAPTPEQAERFLHAVGASPGIVFAHCGAGVGRTGTMVATYLKTIGAADGWDAVRGNLAVGPPSVEQIAYAAGVKAGPAEPLLVAASRVLDAPRRLWTRIRPS